MTQVWRLNIKTAAKPGVDPRALCFNNGFLGVGWQVPGHANSWDEYLDRFGAIGSKCPSAVRTLKDQVKRDDLIWSRNMNGEYWLARVTGDWEYCSDETHVAADVVNIRRCIWVYVGNESSVPGRVASSFASRRTLQRVAGGTVRTLSQAAYNELTPDGHQYPISYGEMDLFAAMLPEDCEDLVGLYLQMAHDYSIVPSTCRRDTPGYEFVLVSRLDGHDAVLQVKNGAVDLDAQRYRDAACSFSRAAARTSARYRRTLFA